ncbi:MAG: gliding motility protein GldL [Bacteroidia bacterium]|nr:gliding motility protein GldL [Bacteroidia bacterium]MCF8426006.1 gliding motility protein GldL [Bacteroidia bacterium]MCF8445399.1 gliding motility protein GldL [Bacteroidia bacterium]
MKNSFLESKGFKSFMAKAYGIGAAVVIIGALFKILHWPGADAMLMVGLLTEAAIFFISAFEPPHQEPDWSLVYPELAGLEPKEKKAVSKGTLTQQLDKMMEEAKIGPDLISSLGNGMRTLSENVTSMKDLSTAAVATDAYTKNVQAAADSLTGINTTYTKAVSAMEGLVNASEGSREYGAQIEKMTKNLNSLNSIYELEISESNNHLKSINEFVGGLSKVVNTLNESTTNAEHFKGEMDKLNKNLSSLNSVYGNMLAAMNTRSN